MAKRDLILHNFKWKVVSLLLATLTWITIWTAFLKDQALRDSPVITESRRSFSVPITLMTSATNANPFTITPATVEVVVTGKATDLAKLQARQIIAFADVTDAAGEHELRREIQVQTPRNVKVETLKPLYATVEQIATPK